jgi:hypothetical protein
MCCWLGHIQLSPARHGRPVGAETPAGNANLRLTQRGVVCNGGHSETVCIAREDSKRVSVRIETEILTSAVATCLRSKLPSTRAQRALSTRNAVLSSSREEMFQ